MAREALTADECEAIGLDGTGRYGFYERDERGDVYNTDNGERVAVVTPNGSVVVYDEDARRVGTSGGGMTYYAFPMYSDATADAVLVDYVPAVGSDIPDAFDGLAEAYGHGDTVDTL